MYCFASSVLRGTGTASGDVGLILYFDGTLCVVYMVLLVQFLDDDELTLCAHSSFRELIVVCKSLHRDVDIREHQIRSCGSATQAPTHCKILCSTDIKWTPIPTPP